MRDTRGVRQGMLIERWGCKVEKPANMIKKHPLGDPIKRVVEVIPEVGVRY